MDYRENVWNAGRTVKFQASEYSDRIRNLNKLEDRILGDRIKQIDREKRFSINLINREIRLTERDLEAKQETLQALYNKEKLKILHENLHVVLLAKERLNEKIRMNLLRYQTSGGGLTSQQSVNTPNASANVSAQPQARTPSQAVRFNTRVNEVASASAVRSRKEPNASSLTKRPKSAKASITFTSDLSVEEEENDAKTRTTTTPLYLQNPNNKSARSLASGASQTTESSLPSPTFLPEMPMKRSKSSISLEKLEAAAVERAVERKRSSTVIGKNLIRPRAQVVNPENRTRKNETVVQIVSDSDHEEFMRPNLSRSVETMSISTSSSRQSMNADQQANTPQTIYAGQYQDDDDLLDAELGVQEIDVDSIADDEVTIESPKKPYFQPSSNQPEQRRVSARVKTPRFPKNTPRYAAAVGKPPKQQNDDNDVVFSPRPVKEMRNKRQTQQQANQVGRSSNGGMATKDLVHVQNLDGGLIFKQQTGPKLPPPAGVNSNQQRNSLTSSPLARNIVAKRK